MLIETTKIEPTKGETYRVGFDDNCMYIGSKHLSKSMCKWIAENYEAVFKKAEEELSKVKEMSREDYDERLRELRGGSSYVVTEETQNKLDEALRGDK